jgi:shikimate kinase
MVKTSIALIGMPGSGKTTVGQLLAQALNFNFVDTDQWIEHDQGISIREIFSALGEPAFRNMEKELWSRIGTQSNTIFATGGGMAVSTYFWNIPVLTVYLKADINQIINRLDSDSTRPLLLENGSQRLVDLFDSRKSHYERADLHIETGGIEPEEVAQRIIDAL